MPQTKSNAVNRPPHVVAVILNTNRRQDTLECLASLGQSTYEACTVILLDNDSSDGSVEAVHEAHPDVEIIRLPENLGYAGNNNVGIRAALDRGADWVLVLNEDTIVAPDCLAHLVNAGICDPRIGIVGPMVYHHDEPDVIQSAGGKLGPRWESHHLGQNEPDRGQFAQPHAVDWISGCGIMLRRDVIRQAGMIDERYFYYWEETEWCIRAGRQGWRILVVPQAKMWHKGVQRNYQPKPSVTYYATRNRLLTLAKHAPLRVRLSAWGEMARTLASWSIRPKWRHLRDHRNAMGHGMMDFLCHRWGRMPD